MARNLLLLSGGLILLMVTGCGSSETIVPDDQRPEHVIFYQSNRIVLEKNNQDWSLALQVFTGCEEIPCTPEEVRLVFFSRSDQPRYANSRRLRIEAGGIRLEWPGPRYDAAAYDRRGRVEQVSVVVSFTDFRDIAFADTVEGRLGPILWEITYRKRSSLRSIVRQFE